MWHGYSNGECAHLCCCTDGEHDYTWCADLEHVAAIFNQLGVAPYRVIEYPDYLIDAVRLNRRTTQAVDEGMEDELREVV